ncbi:MAG TPA: CoA transferase, partial [Gaiellaceae bacterium]|nr:CoA transferase [Gaiellaceae bacterium]
VAAPTEEDAAALRTLAGADPSSPAFQAYTASLTRDELVDVAQLWRVPVVPALSPDEAIGRRELLGAPDGASPFLIAPANGRARSRRRRGPLPLSGLRVLDLGMVWAGPWCGRLLAGLGANVVKIEGPARSDGTRAAGSGCSGAFADLNRGKRSLVLDLGREEGRAAFLRLARSADALIENFSPRVMPNFGLGHDRLAAETGLLTLALPAFPSRGPWSSYVAYGGGVELAAGLAPMGAHAAPEPAPVPYLDYLSGSYGAAAVVAAIVARDRSGATARIELAQWALAECLLRANGSRPLSPADACDVDALLARPALAGGGLVDRDGAEDGPCSHYRRLPFAISGVRTRRELPAPAFGADSRRVLAGWARVGPEQLAALVAGGIVREADAG